MRSILLAALLPALFAGQHTCSLDFTNPRNVAPQVLKAMQPYFPEARVLVSRHERAIMVITCMTGDGPQLVNEIATALRANPGLQNLGFIGGSYNYMALVFRDRMIVYLINTRQVVTGEKQSLSAQQYDSTCVNPNSVILDPRPRVISARLMRSSSACAMQSSR